MNQPQVEPRDPFTIRIATNHYSVLTHSVEDAAFQNIETAHGVCFTAETTSGVQSLNGFTMATPASMKWR